MCNCSANKTTSFPLQRAAHKPKSQIINLFVPIVGKINLIECSPSPWVPSGSDPTWFSPVNIYLGMVLQLQLLIVGMKAAGNQQQQQQKKPQLINNAIMNFPFRDIPTEFQ